MLLRSVVCFIFYWLQHFNRSVGSLCVSVLLYMFPVFFSWGSPSFQIFSALCFVWFRAQVVRFCPLWYIAFDRRRIVFVAKAVWLFFGCWRCRLDYMSQSFLTWEAMRGHITIFVAHKTTPSNTTESSATTAEHRCHMRSFSNTPFAVRQQCSLGGRGEVDVHYKKTPNYLPRRGDHVFMVFVTC